MRHQQYAAVMSKNIVLNELKVENILSIKLCQFSNPFDAIELLRKVNGFEKCDEETEICTTNQIWFNNYNYKHNYIVCFGHDPVFPKFGVIVEFLITDEKTCYLLLNKLEVQYFDRNYFSYRVKLKHDVYELCDVTKLEIHECMELMHNCNSDGIFVSVRHHI